MTLVEAHLNSGASVAGKVNASAAESSQIEHITLQFIVYGVRNVQTDHGMC